MRLLPTCATFGALLALAPPAFADSSTIRKPGLHPRYSLEAEPHVVFSGGPFGPAGDPVGDGFGVGGRFTFPLVDNGFVSKINNSVGLGVGLDWVSFGSGRLYCDRPNGPNSPEQCTEASVSYAWIPVVLQWNFWLTERWSVFGEPGAAIRFMSEYDTRHRKSRFEPFVMYVGGRYLLTESVALTLRAGYPAFSVGASFLL